MYHISSLEKSTVLVRTLRFIGAGLTCVAILGSSAAQAQGPTVIGGPIAPWPGQVTFDFLGFPNLVWGNRSSYRIEDPSSERITVDALGVDDDVDVVDYESVVGPTGTIDVREEFSNRSDAFVAAGHRARLRLYPMQLVTVGGATVWARGEGPVRELFGQPNPGQPGRLLRPGESEEARFEVRGRADSTVCVDPRRGFNPSDPNPLCIYDPNNPELQDEFNLSCGMYEVELTVDSDDVVDEGRSGEFDNVTRHHLFLKSGQTFSIERDQDFSIWDKGPTVPPLFRPREKFATFNLVVPGWSTASALYYIQLTHKARHPEVGIFSTPAPAPWRTNPILVGPGSVVPIIMEFSFAGPPADTSRYSTSRITVISEDGCVIRQRSVSLEVRW